MTTISRKAGILKGAPRAAATSPAGGRMDWLRSVPEELGGWTDNFARKLLFGLLAAGLVSVPMLALTAATDARLGLSPVFLIAILTASWCGGLVGGLSATMLCSMVVFYAFTPPYDRFSVEGRGVAPFIGFCIAAVLIDAFNFWRRGVEHELVSSRRELALLGEGSRQRAEELTKANQSKDEFLSLVSHELKSPLTTIIGASRFLSRQQQGSIKEATRVEIAAEIYPAALRLNRVIDALLVLARIDQGQEIEIEPVALSPLAERVISDVSDHGHQTIATSETCGAIVLANSTCVEQVLRNLISNAQKYSPSSSLIQVSINEVETGVILAVADQGPGVVPAETEKIFEPFFRSQEAVTTATGLGIGLAASKRLVEAMKGQIWVRDASGGGAEFCVLLPKVTSLETQP